MGGLCLGWVRDAHGNLLMSVNFLYAYVYQCVHVLPRYYVPCSKCFSDTKSSMGHGVRASAALPLGEDTLVFRSQPPSHLMLPAPGGQVPTVMSSVEAHRSQEQLGLGLSVLSLQPPKCLPAAFRRVPSPPPPLPLCSRDSG